ncbi:MAG TPA: helix-turn-helix domain-containing protein [Mycobacteriales bacterium]|jgi:DNA-binding transcriptional MerR regulator|nr:helix-turn-helix domain-containing protein [Mycobacteriales bacterium]
MNERSHRLDLLTTAEVAAEFRVPESTVRYWRQTGYGPKGVRVGRRVLYERGEIDRWWKRRTAGSPNLR